MRDDQIAIVTGGSTGIGKAIAKTYLECGAEVVIVNRAEEAGRETAAKLGCDFLQCDISDYEQVLHLVESTIDKYDRLNAVVNNGGIGRVGTVEDMTLKDCNDVIRINLTGGTTSFGSISLQ